jgi:diketogulonate reductase-like aldo/keto reductase
LIHAPACELDVDEVCAEGPMVWRDTWMAMEALRAEGVAKHLGVSNFEVDDLDQLLTFATVAPAVVQNWFDPLHRDRAVRKWCRANKVGFQAYSVLGSGWTDDGAPVNPVLTNQAVIGIAKEKQRSVAQVVLRWAMQSGVGVIVGARSREHLSHDLSLGDFYLSESQMKGINGLSHKKKKPAADSGEAPAYTDSDDCLSKRCAGQWEGCETAAPCAVCEHSCENDASDAGYVTCCEACVAGKEPAVVSAMQKLLKCFNYCLRFG